MTREEKILVVEKLKEKFKNNQNFYFTDASGMSVAKTNDFRRMCFSKGVDYTVYKNSLIKKALESAGKDDQNFEEVLKGFSGIMFSDESASLPARVLKDFRKNKDGKPFLKAASIDSEIYIGDENLSALSNLKTKNELIADVIALLQSPAKNVISALQSGGHTISGLVKALAERES
ncbi:MAG: 50S ribosomal protein L10 [Cyclobacteriaceae bacterium]|nr:50S ribosomal protein L10 [Cyclobacteriaceae bacterium]